MGVGLPLLAACGGSDGSTATDGGSTPSAGEKLGPASDVPVGGGTIYADQKLVVTQPTDGEFKAFTAVCTHQGCLVANVDGGTINCACHGSKFALADGAVVNGPAATPLPARTAKVEGSSVVVSA